jgi:aryl-alcohol dehydrogenase-like predicted oxidoreductase
MASNQVHYSLLHRAPERNGALKACQELDVRLIAYSPLEQGILTGKYHQGTRPPGGSRGVRGAYRPSALRASLPLIQCLETIGAAHDGKTPSQVALNWLMRRGALPIPGAKTAAQAVANAGAFGWDLTDEEFAQLDKLKIRDWGHRPRWTRLATVPPCGGPASREHSRDEGTSHYRVMSTQRTLRQ